MKVIQCPANMSQKEVDSFLTDCGYRKKDFTFVKKNNLLYIRPNVQMILAQDSLALGFKKVDIAK